MAPSERKPAQSQGTNVTAGLIATLLVIAVAATFLWPVHVKPGCREAPPDLAPSQAGASVNSGVYGAMPLPRCA